jgi:AbiV family abortive infection protein
MVKKDKRPQPPKPGSKLYENLFEGLEYDSTLKRISEGIHAVIANTSRLIEEAELLAESDRFATAGFLLATADEEIAKIYILLDMCRLDLLKHESTLKNLCRAFYDHVAKHAYSQTVRFQLRFQDMKRLKELWIAEITRWFPSGYESEEPDFPHSTYFTRQLPLYVDYIGFDQKWHVPDQALERYRFEKILGESSLTKSKRELAEINASAELKFFSSKILILINQVFKNHFISEKTQPSAIERIYQDFQDQLPENLQKHFVGSVLNQWPIYSFVHILR